MSQQDNQMDIFADDVLSSQENMEMSLDKDDNSDDNENVEEVDQNETMSSAMSYEEAVAKLERIVARLESGEAALDESMELFQQGMKLTAFCSNKLNSMEEKITKLLLQSDGSYKELPLEDKQEVDG